MRKKIVAGNWKMHKKPGETEAFFSDFLQEFESGNTDQVLFFPPYTSIGLAAWAVKDHSSCAVGAQNLHEKEQGAFTGEVSGEMIKASGADYVLVGHSERRTYQQESNELLRAKIARALEAELIPVYCCGETLEQRQSNQHFATVEQQVKVALNDFKADELANLIIAYEPVWAIGSGETASPEQANEMHQHIRKLINSLFGNSFAENCSILYGGSVKPNNAADLFSREDIDGALVGGASLKPQDFQDIIKAMP